MPTAHIINHTHWDREWFLTHEYTTAWIPELIDSIRRLADENPEYEFLFDGQSLVIEDLLKTRPDRRDLVQQLVSKGNLAVGPLYSQPDWRMVSGELHLRNLTYGIADAEALGGRPDVAWLVDTFGHISQAPQMLSLAGVNAAFVWRGVPEMTPVFSWEGADGTRLPTVDLFGGYRNLYGITKTADIAVDRLVAEVDKLADSYGELPIPLFDGYDLDTEPEDPIVFYDGLPIPDRVRIVASSPRRYVDAVLPFVEQAPTLRGELISGKFGSTFPGSLSARTYLKVLHHDSERALHRRIEPLAALASAFDIPYDAAAYEQTSRELLQNGVHDCLCGVSIDQVHERMERSYRRLLGWADERQHGLTSAIIGGFAPGIYAVSTNSMPSSSIVRTADSAVQVATDGIGITQAVESHPVRKVDAAVDSFNWSNARYIARLDAEGLIIEGVGRLLRLVVITDSGDTYSSEPGAELGDMPMSGPITVVDETDVDTTVRFEMVLVTDDISVSAMVDARFDDGPLIDLTVTIDSTGTGFRVDAEFETSIVAPTVWAHMPFDVVERAHDDHNLLGQQIDPDLAAILMGQRETGHVTEFPFHDYVAIGDDTRSAAVLSKGLRSYRSTPEGTITITLRRSVEWIARIELELRSGDAGPAMYVPGARSERVVEHRIGFASLGAPLAASAITSLSETFHNPPITAEVTDGNTDGPTFWSVFSCPLPSTGLFQDDLGTTLVRLYNPTEESVDLATPLSRRSLRGVDLGESSTVRSKEIVTAVVAMPVAPTSCRTHSTVIVHTPITDRGGRSRSRPEAEALDALDARIDRLTGELATVHDELVGAVGTSRFRVTHRQYVVERELLELRLSRELNDRLLHSTDEVSIPDEPDPIIAELGLDLNDLRVKRRIYDYVVQALASSE